MTGDLRPARAHTAVAFLVLALFSFEPASQEASPMVRYNRVADRMYQLERCNEMTQERWEWLEEIRTRAAQALGWDEIVAQEHDKLLIVDFNARYRAGIARERCEELARAADAERKGTAKTPTRD